MFPADALVRTIIAEREREIRDQARLRQLVRRRAAVARARVKLMPEPARR